MLLLIIYTLLYIYRLCGQERKVSLSDDRTLKMADYKSILVKNEDRNCNVTLFIYSRFDPICWISSSSKILLPGKSHLHRSKNEFKFEIKKTNNTTKKTVVNVRKYERDIQFKIANTDEVRESALEHHALEKQMCIRKLNLEKETSLGEGRNLYEILKLNYKEIRKLDKDEQDAKIKKAFHQEIRKWHSDVASEFADNKMAHEVIAAYDILRDRKKRADYNNVADYSKGWLSKARWRSIFWAECETEEQKWKYRKRLAMLALSVGVAIGVAVLCAATAGAATPAVVAGGILGGGCLGGGTQGLFRTINKKVSKKDVTSRTTQKVLGLDLLPER